jgi:hypothetical protein
MNHPLIEIKIIAQSPGDFLRSTGQAFAVFDERTQDSGNISYGVLAGDMRFFVKTAGMPENSQAHLPHEQRVALLRNAVSFRRSVDHYSRPELLNVIESPHGPMLVYEWVPGELLGVERSRRADPASPFQRFRALPLSDLIGGEKTLFPFRRKHERFDLSAFDEVDRPGAISTSVDVVVFRDLNGARALGFLPQRITQLLFEQFSLRSFLNHARVSFRCPLRMKTFIPITFRCASG